MSAGFSPLQDTIDVACRTSELIENIGSIRNQTATRDVKSPRIDGGQFVTGRKRDDQIAMKDRRRTRSHDQATIGEAREGSHAAFDLSGVT
jgi:predicted helicase